MPFVHMSAARQLHVGCRWRRRVTKLWRRWAFSGLWFAFCPGVVVHPPAAFPIGASELRRVLTSGGGSQNAQWTVMRQALLGVPTSRAANIDAAYGAALLAARGAG